ncbi:hypothetical protein DXG01_002254 [Tephrocybe rancida]|nr:hypothetical protein DXG01_002254 [Tephrocybe rancida]
MGLLNNAFIDYTQNYYPNKRGLDYYNGSGCFGSPSSVGLVNFPSSPASSTRSLMEDIDKFTLEDDAYSYPTSYLWQTSGTIDPSDIERNSGMAASRSPTSTLSTPFSIELQLYSPIINQHATVNSTIEESFFTPPLSTSSKLFSSVVGMAQTATIQERINEDSPPQVLTDARLKRARPNQGQPIPMDCSKHDAFQVPHTGADGYDTAGFRKVVGTQAARDATDKRRQRAPMHFCEVEGCGRSFTSRGNLKSQFLTHRWGGFR